MCIKHIEKLHNVCYIQIRNMHNVYKVGDDDG